jgi:hypothetical protein
MRIIFVLLVSLLLFVGCAKNGSVEYIQVVHDHKVLTNETLDAVVASIQDDVANIRSAGKLTPEIETSAQQLIDRLIVIKMQSTVMSNYVDTIIVDEELLSQLVRARWDESREY